MSLTTYIALLRGVNVGGKNRLPMKELRATLAGLGLTDVKTYIQSGNAVFRWAGSAQGLTQRITDAIQAEFGFRSQALILDPGELRSAIENNPYAQAADHPKGLHLYFLGSNPAADGLQRAQALAASNEACEQIGAVFYLWAPDGVARSKLAVGVDRAYGVTGTARNLRSAQKILELAESI